MESERTHVASASGLIDAPQLAKSAALRRTFAWPMLKRSLGVAVVVGTGLNLINQGDAIFAHHNFVFWKLALTYAVPFGVSSYGSYSALKRP